VRSTLSIMQIVQSHLTLYGSRSIMRVAQYT